jgi:hypothetical protein
VPVPPVVPVPVVPVPVPMVPVPVVPMLPVGSVVVVVPVVPPTVPVPVVPVVSLPEFVLPVVRSLIEPERVGLLRPRVDPRRVVVVLWSWLALVPVRAWLPVVVLPVLVEVPAEPVVDPPVVVWAKAAAGISKAPAMIKGSLAIVNS